MKWERWQAEPDGEGASAAEAKWLEEPREVLLIPIKLSEIDQDAQQ